jgi:hypothetical protein
MFGFTKKSDENSKENNPENPNPPITFSIEDAPIHTMQDDLKNLKTPTTHSQAQMPERKDIFANQSLPKKQETNPFLSSASNNFRESEKKETLQAQPTTLADKAKSITATISLPPISSERKPESPENTTFKATPSMTKDYSVFSYSWKLFFFIALLVFLLGAIGWLGFRYYEDEEIKSSVENPPVINPQVTEEKKEEEKEQNPITTPVLTYSTTNPNYLRLEDPTLDPEKTKTVLRQHKERVFAEKHILPIEFVVTDAQNKALGFENFSKILGLNFSPALMALLGENFNLFMYNDNASSKIGISIESKDDINLAKVLISEEKKLADEISPLFFTTEYRAEKDFASSEYGTVKIRYQNVISPDTLSVDYAVYKNKLLIGTTKLTLRSIIDKLNGVTIPEKGLEPEPMPTELEKN